MRYFIAVADHLHFGRAAEKMNVVQSAISQQIKRLEEELGTELFERSGNEIRLTEAAILLLPEFRKLILQAEKAEQVARQATAGKRGRINLAFVDNAVCTLLPPLVRAFSKQFPDVELILTCMDRMTQATAIKERSVDIGLIPGPVSDAEFDTQTFVQAPLLAALPARHPLAAEKKVSLARLASEPFVLFPASARTRILEVILAACAAANFTPRVAQEASQMHTLLALVDAGIGVSLVPQWVASTEAHDVVFREIFPASAPYELTFTWLPGTTNKAIFNLRAIARQMDLGYTIDRLPAVAPESQRFARNL